MIPRLHVVTDDRVLARSDFLARATAVLEAGDGDVALHVRGPHSSGAALYHALVHLQRSCRDAGPRLFVNDRVDLALGLDLRGVHLGRRSLPPGVSRALVGDDVLLGWSVHAAAQAEAGDADVVDYVFTGAVFETASHPGRAALGLDGLTEVCRRAPCPVIGIGGITVGRVRATLGRGAHGVAVLAGIWEAPEPGAAVLEYLAALAER